jgi:hypothetical protein
MMQANPRHEGTVDGCGRTVGTEAEKAAGQPAARGMFALLSVLTQMHVDAQCISPYYLSCPMYTSIMCLTNVFSPLQFIALFCMMCCAPAYEGPQHWFLLVVALAFLGTIFFSLYYLCLAEPLNKMGVNWLMGVSITI